MKNIFTLLYLLSFCAFSQSKDSLNQFVDLEKYDVNFIYDIRYATSNNFLKEPIYNCATCLLLPEVAQALTRANYYFCDLGYQIKIFDCYRPLSAQKKMWKIYPNPRYVANPYTNKSVHNRAAAVDLTLVDADGNQLDMGTTYDYFGEKAHQDFKNLPAEVLQNRKLLREGLEKFGFHIIRTEWWHYDFGKAYAYPIFNVDFPCH
ncbi:D-alanyl-D-alanine dipeptidase [Mesonia phycicola]|uniref:D-alanyl-D-alanine dipeptidase n=1 Tax=Mesonia phycicola TaxID=579105 RepID=A0A1M6BN97_9FLAO|nr:M15 family metallopeptidase [Mesonia phycicola]SHI50250.1 D-alanyl-D-alanine dipeptidase [Mesonia phycicola]